MSDEVGEEQLQSSLFDILGFEEFELIGKIVQNKQVVIGEKQQDDIDTEPKLLTAAERAQLLIDNHQKTKNQKLAPKSLTQQYPNVFKNPDVGNMISVTGKKFSLPVGTTRESHATHEEIIIPYPEQKANRWILDSNLVKVSQLDFLCQGTFKNYQTLNKMQSLVYPVAYNTNENMLVCAPTGAGKTDVALLTILHCINPVSYTHLDVYKRQPYNSICTTSVSNVSKSSNTNSPVSLNLGTLTNRTEPLFPVVVLA